MFIAVACAKPNQQGPEVAEAPVTPTTSYNTDSDLEITRLYDWPRSGGSVPSRLKWSDNSEMVAFLRRVYSKSEESFSFELWIYEIENNRERPLLSSAKMSVSTYDWCADNSLIFTSKGDLYTVDLEGKTRRLTKDGGVTNPKCSPNGDKVAFLYDHGISMIDLINLDDKLVTPRGTP